MFTTAKDAYRVHILQCEMESIRKCSFVCFVWMLLLFPSAIKTQNCTELNTTQTVHLGMSITVKYHYSTNSSLHSVVYFRRKHLLCHYIFQNTSWTKASCESHIKFIWIQETEEIAFELLNLQISNSGIYTLTVEEYAPPPARCVIEKRIFIHVIASPSVTVSCVKGPDGAPTVVCTSESFYPDDLEQVWLRDGEKNISYSNTSHTFVYEGNRNTSDRNFRKNTDGSYNLTSYLHLASPTAQKVMYCCWVNHSTLSQPITVNISSTECTEREKALAGLFSAVAGSSCGVMAGIGLILCSYQCLRRRRNLQSPVGASPLPELVYHSAAQTQVYSTLGNHRPVPCKINGSRATSPSL
ncbi:uncharacterized protein LOC113543640 [Pangasianodon hypophthalmus]|uniref:uncharacterized protein LOC113543640 n=1 Tax=Pangasianodon hypophthalmus TaxID=310915 RepID=UPI002307C105|nr:uncharacterized protein LOC113543640 [Pangasianodon hypophthalmus]